MTHPIAHHPDPCGPSCVAKPMESKSQIGFEHNECLEVDAEVWGEPGTDEIPPAYFLQCMQYMDGLFDHGEVR